MQILITNNNIDLFKELHPKAKISLSSVNTSIINCTVKTFTKILDGIRAKKINPYSVMYW